MLTVQHRNSFYPRMRSEFARMVTEVNDCIDMEGWDCHMVSSDDRAMLYFQRTKVKSLADVNSARQVRPSAGNRFSPDAVFLHCLSYDVPCGIKHTCLRLESAPCRRNVLASSTCS